MTANKHTPGPWEVVNGKDIFTTLGAMNAEGVYSPFNDGWHIASMGECTCSISGEQIGLDYREANANARLIAAAPDLLEACQTFSEWLRREEAGFPAETRFGTPDGEAKWREWYFENLRICDLAQTLARDAIAKATGGAE